MRIRLAAIAPVLATLLGLASVSPAAAQGPAAPPPKEVVIGALYPLTGNLAQLGIDSLTAIRLAIDIVNTGGSTLNLPLGKTAGLPNLGGAKIRLVVVDHQGKPELGQAEAERLITQEKVHVLLGAVHSSVTATASQVAERHGIPFFNCESSSPTLTERGFKWFFRTSPHDGHFSQVMFDFIRDFEKKRGVKFKSVGILNEDTLFGADSAKVQEALAKQYGYEVAIKMAYRAKTTSLDAEVGKLKAANPDIFLPTSYTTDGVLFVKTAKQLDYVPKMLVAQNAGWVDPQFVAEMKEQIEGHITRSPFAMDLAARKPLIAPVNALFKKMKDNPGGRDLTDAPARGFTGMMTLADAINRAKSVSPEEIRKALAATNIPAEQLIMPWTGVRFDEKGQNAGVRAILMQMQKGAYATIYPFDLAAADVLYPLPGYKGK
jgi:branched-chain amino acid transport system substrate-binding protein